MKPVHTVFLLSLLWSAGCDTKAANDANLENGLNHYLGQMEPCLGYTVRSFPLIRRTGGTDTALDALTEAGLLTRTQTVQNGTAQDQYDLTGKGKDTNFPGHSVRKGDPGLFCFGVIQVDKIANFTEPAEADGMHVTRVTYTRKLVHQPSWAKNPAIQEAFPNYAAEGYGLHPQTSGMMLTSHGWRVINDDQP